MALANNDVSYSVTPSVTKLLCLETHILVLPLNEQQFPFQIEIESVQFNLATILPLSKVANEYGRYQDGKC